MTGAGQGSLDMVALAREALRRAGLDARRVSVIGLNRSAEDDTALALLAFVDDGDRPAAFLKAAPAPGGAAPLEREFRNLTELHDGGDEVFRRSIPRPLYFGEIGSFAVLAESATPGVRMKNFPPDRYFASKRFGGHFEQIVGWLGQFHRIAGGRDAPRSPAESASVTLAQYRHLFRVSPALDTLLTESQERLAASEIPWTVCHGDFCTANVLIDDDDRIAVIDWEHLEIGWPLADLLHFLTSVWCIPYAKGSARLAENYRTLFFETGHHASGVRDAVSSYLDELQIARDLALPLSVLAWAAAASRKRGLMSRDAEKAHLPLILIEDDACLNLDLLATHRARYALKSL